MIEIPEPVVSFIREWINSVEQLEMLLLLKRHPEKEWTAQEMSRALSSNPDAVASRLVPFEAVRLVAVKPGPEPRFRYQPSNPVLDETIRALAEAYSTYSVRVVSLIYSKPI